ncbi:hypothetical protein DIPPA_21083 [Diplonema papillatum]|nr:hypothetical protein DIPPA_21083 [Diplonema papillatum]
MAADDAGWYVQADTLSQADEGKKARKMLEAVFSQFDRDRDGVWNYDEARQARLLLTQEDMPPDEYSLICEEINADPSRGWQLENVSALYGSDTEALAGDYNKVMEVQRRQGTRYPTVDRAQLIADGLAKSLKTAPGKNGSVVATFLQQVRDQNEWDAVVESFQGHPQCSGGDLLAALRADLLPDDAAACKSILRSKGIDMVPRKRSSQPRKGASHDRSSGGDDAFVSQLADRFHKAMKGLGTDEEALFSTARQLRTPTEYEGVKAAFSAQHPAFHGGDLEEAFHDELTVPELGTLRDILSMRGIPFMTAPQQQQQHQQQGRPNAGANRFGDTQAQTRRGVQAVIDAAIDFLASPDPDVVPLLEALGGLVAGPEEWGQVLRGFAQQRPALYGGDLTAALHAELSLNALGDVRDALAYHGIDFFNPTRRPRPQPGASRGGGLPARNPSSSAARSGFHRTQSATQLPEPLFQHLADPPEGGVGSGWGTSLSEEIALPFSVGDATASLEARAVFDYTRTPLAALRRALQRHGEERRQLHGIAASYALVADALRSALAYKVAENVERLRLEERGFQRTLSRQIAGLNAASDTADEPTPFSTASTAPARDARPTPRNPPSAFGLGSAALQLRRERVRSWASAGGGEGRGGGVLDMEAIAERLDGLVEQDFADRGVEELKIALGTHERESLSLASVVARHSEVGVSLQDALAYRVTEEAERIELDRKGRERLREQEMSQLLALQRELEHSAGFSNAGGGHSFRKNPHSHPIITVRKPPCSPTRSSGAPRTYLAGAFDLNQAAQGTYQGEKPPLEEGTRVAVTSNLQSMGVLCELAECVVQPECLGATGVVAKILPAAAAKPGAPVPARLAEVVTDAGRRTVFPLNALHPLPYPSPPQQQQQQPLYQFAAAAPVSQDYRRQ